jgi:hypothetical protein
LRCSAAQTSPCLAQPGPAAPEPGATRPDWAAAGREGNVYGARIEDGRVRCHRRNGVGKGAGRQPPACLCAAEKRRSAGPRAQRASFL